MNTAILKAGGIDYEAGVARFMKDAELYETVLLSYLSDTVTQRARDAFERGDNKALLFAAHEAKGSSGSADLVEVYQTACALVDLLRRESYTSEELAERFHCYETASWKARQAIQAACE